MKTLIVGDKTPKAEVHRAQKLLSGNNVFNHRTYWAHGVDLEHGFDGTMGKASENMKYWLGYDKHKCSPMFGDEIADYLLGNRKLSLAMKTRRIARGFTKKPIPIVTKKAKYLSPIFPGHKWTHLGGPGEGTHSFSVPPNNWQSDNARDFGCLIGTPLVAVSDGVIGSRIGPISHDGGRFAGLRFYLECNDGNQFYYAHCSRIDVHAGQKVKAGQVVAKSGVASGVAHLHIGEMRGNPMHDLPVK